MTGGLINIPPLTFWGILVIRVPRSYVGVCTYSERQFVAPNDPDARDAAVVVCAKQDDTCKGVFSEFVQALEHAYNNRQFRSTPTSHEHDKIIKTTPKTV